MLKARLRKNILLCITLRHYNLLKGRVYQNPKVFVVCDGKCDAQSLYPYASTFSEERFLVVMSRTHCHPCGQKRGFFIMLRVIIAFALVHRSGTFIRHLTTLLYNGMRSGEQFLNFSCFVCGRETLWIVVSCLLIVAQN